MRKASLEPPIPLDTVTALGTIKAISFRDGERYYMLIDKYGIVSLMPDDVVRESMK